MLKRMKPRARRCGHPAIMFAPSIPATVLARESGDCRTGFRRSLGHRLDFRTQSLGYSLLRQRSKGEITSASEWPGYRAGQNRRGAGLNVAEELRQPQRLGPGGKYDALVVRSVHDLPAIARTERTAFYLTEMSKHLLSGNPDAEVLLYHTWLHVDPDAPWPWIGYERAVSPMWECVASRANLDLPPRGDVPRVRVLPGGSALAEMAAALWTGKVPGVAASDPGARIASCSERAYE